MAKTEIISQFLQLLWAAMDAERHVADASLLTDANAARELLHLAKEQDLAHVVSYVVSRDGLVTDAAVRARLEKAELVAAFRCESMKVAFDTICATLDAAAIDYVPLKGSVLRPYYPEQSMRTSCDIDILIHEADLDAAVAALVALGYRAEERAFHDVSLYSPDGIHLELHFSICENVPTLDAVLAQAWEHTVPVHAHCFAFTPAFFCFHMMAHMAYHFLEGGCGIRPLLDLWIMEHRMDISYLTAEPLLRRAGIDTFAAEMHVLAQRCFADADPTVASDEAIAYLLDGGVYGSLENAVAVSTADTGTARYFLGRLFLPYAEMVVGYPILRRAPILLPACWIVRLVRTLFGGRARRAITEAACAARVGEDTLDGARRLRSRFGL